MAETCSGVETSARLGGPVRRLFPVVVLFQIVVLALFGCSRQREVAEVQPVESLSAALDAANWPADGLTATNSVYIKERTGFSGDVAVTNAVSGPTLSSGASVVLGSQATLTGSVRADIVQLQNQSRVTGNAHLNTLSGSGQVLGTVTTGLPLPLPVVIPALPAMTPGTQAVTVNHSQTLTLGAGAYGSVTIQNGNGGVKSKLQLTGGVYHFASLTVNNDAELRCQAACEVRVAGRVTIADRSFVGPGSNPAVGPGNVQLLVKGNNQGSFPWSTPAAFSVANDVEVRAYVLVPNGTVAAGDRVQLIGKVVARDISLGRDGNTQGVQLPTILTQPSSQTVAVGSSVQFQVAAEGQGLGFQWQRGGVNVAGATTTTLTIPSVTAADDGAVFTVRVSNAAGTVWSQPATLSVTACASTDTTCDGVDDDCDGTTDEDYVIVCQGDELLTCSGGVETAVTCNDGNACNGVESCGAGGCLAGTAPVVDDGNPCTTDSCDPTTGVSNEPVSAGTSCGDGNACNGDEFCDAAGVCLAGTAPVVDDGNPCTTDSCDPTTGVSNAPVSAGTSCGDGNACNGNELCDAAGSCLAGTAPVVDDGNPCTTDSCDPTTGVSNLPVAAGTSCGDGNACNGDELCDAAGSCQAGTAPVVDDGNPCTSDSCDPTTGVSNQPVAAGTSCGDGNACNGDELCDAAGVCLAGTAPTVDDGNPCTTDSCDPITGVSNEPVSAGTSCGDGNACNGNELCDAAGSCLAGTAPNVDDGNPCTTDSCDPTTGVSNEPVSVGTSCGDGDACNGDELCDAAGVCLAGTAPVVDDGNPCTTDTCDPVTGVSNEPVSAGTGCGDGDVCNGEELCDASGGCQAGTALPVDDGNSCTNDSCDPELGVMNIPYVAGTGCPDSDLCNGDELCDEAATCQPGTAPIIDDGNPCTADSCDAVGGVSNVPVSAGASCSDGDVCNGAEACDGAGTCQAGTPLSVDDGDPCTADSCDPTNGVSNTPVAPGTGCPDGDLCNGDETCDAAGTCVAGQPPAIDDGNVCTVDICSPTTGVSNVPVGVGTSCSDGDLCNGDETCDESAVCLAGSAPVVDDGNPCTTDSCDPIGGVSNVPVAAGTSCGESNACTGSAVCDESGTCQTDGPSLPPSTACTVYSCDPVAGIVGTPANAGDPCELDACTPGTCDATGECLPNGPGALTDDGNPCTVERCDPLLGPIQVTCPSLDETVTTTVLGAYEWIYTGETPIQVGVAPGTIDLRRASLVRATLRNRSGDPIPSVDVNVVGHPEFGTTTTNADGSFLLVVNGGGELQIAFNKWGYLSSARRVRPVWNQTATLEDIVLIPSDPVVTAVDVSAASPNYQVAMGSVVTDDGTSPPRQAAVLFPPNTAAMMHHADGSTEMLDSASVRITEFTVGEQGPAAMPAQLPQNTGYTYAFEVNADEAVIAGAPEIEFNQPLVYYVENFLGFPAGTTVPLGSFDRATGTWSPEQSGIVLDVLAIVGGAAEVDVTGDGVADFGQALDDHSIDAAELQTLATLHGAGASLWRVRLPHFTSPYDANWPTQYPPDAEPPPNDPPQPPPKEPDPNCASGASVIECENQIYHETVAIAGTDFALNYTSERTAGFSPARRLEIPLTGAIVPASLQRIDVVIDIAGRRELLQLAPTGPNARTSWDWDGLDNHGRKLRGRQEAAVKVSYVYNGVYKETSTFGAPATGILEIGEARDELNVAREFRTHLGPAEQYSGLGGWGLDVHHNLSMPTNRLLLGDGSERDARQRALTIENIAGVYSSGFGDIVDGMDARQANLSPGAIAVGPDGSVFVNSGARIYHISPERIITRYAGSASGTLGNSGDGGLATSATLGLVDGMTVDSAGNLYFAQRQNGCTVRKIDATTGIITRVAGKPNVTCVPSADVEGQLAVDVVLDQTRDVAIASDGSLYIAAKTVRRVDATGKITTIAGDGTSEGLTNGIPDGALAKPALPDTLPLNAVALEFDSNGVLYILHENNGNGGPEDRVYRLGSDGRLQRVVGCPASSCSNIASGLATDWRMDTFNNTTLALSPNGQLYVGGRSGSDYSMFTVTRDGQLKALFATNLAPYAEGQLAQLVRMPPRSIAFGPDGLVFSHNTQSNQSRITKITEGITGLRAGNQTIASEGGHELYEFDAQGRHLRTLDAMTSAQIRSFTYDAAGRLASVIDQRSSTPRVTTIERDGEGNPTAIVGPYGQRTELELDALGNLATIRNPESEEYTMTYASDGLIQTFTNPRGGVSEMTYVDGRITVDEDAADAPLSFTRTELPDGWVVERESALGRVTSYESIWDGSGTETRTDTYPNGTASTTLRRDDETTLMSLPDGTQVETISKADRRWGDQTPLTSTTTILPSGLSRTVNRTRTTLLSNELDPLSLTQQTDTVTTNGRAVNTYYQASSRRYDTVSAVGRTSTRILDALGRTSSTQFGNFTPVAFTYDAEGRLDTVTQGTRVTDYSYFSSGAAAGMLQSIFDPAGRTTSMTRDAIGRVLSETLGGATTSFSYDGNSNLTGVTPPGKPTHVMDYTPVNLMSLYDPPAVTGASTPETTYVYDLDRNVDLVTRPDSLTLDYTYDTAGRIASVIAPTGTLTRTYFEPTDTNPGQAPGKLQSLIGPYGVTLDYSYDGMLTTSETMGGDVAGTVSWAYNNNFVATQQSITTPTDSGTTTYRYDNDLLVTCASPSTCPGSDALTLTRGSADGLVTRLTQGNTVEDWAYNNYGELRSQVSSYSGSPLLSLTYDSAAAPRDNLGRIVRKTEVRGGVTKVYGYTYDTLGRLTDVTLNTALIEHYTYDLNGNRLTGELQGEGPKTGVYDDQDRLLSYGQFAYTYTANGELLTKQDTVSGDTWTYSYDVFGNLLSVDLPDGRLVEYITDGRHRRVGKKIDGVMVRQWLYEDQLNPVAELDGAGNVLWHYVYASREHSPDFLVSDAGAVYRVISDQLGSPRLIVNIANSADVLLEAEYTAFGARTVVSGDPGGVTVGFAGGVFDVDTGLTRFGARDYDPVVGRWVSKDPIRFEGRQANIFAYVDNDPINLTDPTGLQSMTWPTWFPPAAGAAAGAAAGSVAGLPGALVGACIGALLFVPGDQPIDDGNWNTRKRDIKEIDRISDKVGLDKKQRRRLHDDITGQDLDLDEIEAIAREIKDGARSSRR